MKKELYQGLLLASLGSFWWGFIGVIYFKYIEFVGYVEVVIHRCVWTTVTLIITTFFFSKWKVFFSIISNKKKNYCIIFVWFINIYKLGSMDLCNFDK